MTKPSQQMPFSMRGPTELPPPGPNRPKSPTLKQLVSAEAPIYAKNVRRPASVIQIDYKDAHGQTAGLPFLLPVTDVPIPLSGSSFRGDLIPYESVKNSAALGKAIAKGAVRLYWPDEVEPLLTPEALEDIEEAMTYAQNPNQEGYFPDRESEDVIVEADEREMQTAAESQPLNGRAVSVIAQLQKGTLGAQRAIRELQSVMKDLRYRDFQHALSTLGESESEEVVRDWIVERINAMDMGIGSSSPDHPEAAGQARLMKMAEAAQYGPRGARVKTHAMPQSGAPSGKRGGGVSQVKDADGNPVVIVDR